MDLLTYMRLESYEIYCVKRYGNYPAIEASEMFESRNIESLINQSQIQTKENYQLYRNLKDSETANKVDHQSLCVNYAINVQNEKVEEFWKRLFSYNGNTGSLIFNNFSILLRERNELSREENDEEKENVTDLK